MESVKDEAGVLVASWSAAEARADAAAWAAAERAAAERAAAVAAAAVAAAAVAKTDETVGLAAKRAAERAAVQAERAAERTAERAARAAAWAAADAGTTTIARFKAALTKLINQHSMECECGNTPDYILSEMAVGFMLHFGEAVDRRENHFTNEPTDPQPITPTIDA